MPRDEKRDVNFEEARQRLRAKYGWKSPTETGQANPAPPAASGKRGRKGSGPNSEALASAARDMYPWFSRQTVQRFFEPTETKFDETTKDCLIQYVQFGFFLMAYNGVARTVQQSSGALEDIRKDLCGNYRYFRYFAPGGDPSTLKFVSGHIAIHMVGNIPTFEHWSHNAETKPPMKPEHQGIVLLLNSYVYMLGYHPGMVRLSISQMPRNTKDHSCGIVLSMRHDQRDPFAARFILMREDNADLIAKLEDQTEHIGSDGKKTTAGEALFFKLTGGGYAYHMLGNKL